MASKLLKLGILALLLVVFSGFAAAQVCEGTLSAPTKEVYVGDDFTLTFFNAEPDSTGGTVTLNLPSGMALVSGSNPVSPIGPWTAYQWDVNASAAGTYEVNVTLESSGVNCTITFDPVVVEDVPEPIIIPELTDLGTLTLNQPVGLELNLTNVGGEALDVEGTLDVNSGSDVSPVSFSHATIANSTTVTTVHTLTPEHCGVDSVTAFVQQVHDANGLDSAPVQVTDLFTVVGSDVAFTTIGATSPVAQGDTATFSFTVENIGAMDAEGVEVEILIDGSPVGTVAVGSLAAGDDSSHTFDHDIGLLSAMDHTVTFRVDGDFECSSVNNEVSMTFTVTTATGPFCGDGICNGGETCSICSGDCGTCGGGTSGGSSSGGGGGGSGGGGSSDTYILILTPENPVKTLKLKTGDTVKYLSPDGDYSFHFRYVFSDKAKVGISQQTSYKEYTFDQDKQYSLNLDDEPLSDLGITGRAMHLGSGNFTFELLNYADRKPILTLPVGSVDRRTVEPEHDSAEMSAELEAGPEDAEPEEEAYSEGVLEFIESLTVKSAAPLWAGIGLALIIILAGLALYFFAVRKEE